MKHCLPSLALLAVLASALPAQDLRRIQPPSPSPSVGSSDVKPEEPAAPAVANPQEVIVPRLAGLYFTATPKARPPAGTKGLAWDPALSIPDKAAVEKALAPLVGKPFRMADMESVIVAVQKAYVAEGLPFSRVVIPEQEVEESVVTVLVASARVGTISWQGTKYYGTEAYGDQLRTRTGAALSKPVLDQDLNWIGRSGYRQVNAFTRPGAAFGTTDVVFNARERFPFSGSLTYQDAGQPLTGDDQFAAVIDWENPLGHHLTYQETDDTAFRSYSGHAGSYSIPLPWHHLLNFNGTYASINPDLPVGFLATNYAWQTGLGYEVPFAPIGFAGVGVLDHSVQAGFILKETNNNLEFGGIPVTNNTTQILEWTFGYNARFQDPYGTTTAGTNLVYGPGGWTDRNNDAYFDVSRSGAKASFAYGNFQFGRSTPLPWGFRHDVTATVQWADGNLLGSEQLGLGGFSTVRGYAEGYVYGDEGYTVRNELKLPPTSLSQIFAPKFGTNIAHDALTPFVFYDRGEANNKHLLTGEAPNVVLSSVGVGFRYVIDRYVSVRFDYGWQLNDPHIATSENSSRGHLGVTVSY